MNLLNKILVLFLIQHFSITWSNPITSDLAKEQFIEFYDQELTIIAENFSEKAKNLSEILLNDKNIQEASTVELKDFKLFLNNFLQDFLHLKRFKLDQPIVGLFVNAVNNSTIDKYDLDYKEQLKFKETVKQYFSSVLQEYEQNYEKFIKDKFLTKSEELQQQLKEEDLKEMPKFPELIEHLKTCHNYSCFPYYLDPVLKPLNINRETLIKYSKIDLLKFMALIATRYHAYGFQLLNDEKVRQLSPAIRTTFIEDIYDYQTKFLNNNDIDKFVHLMLETPFYPKKYDDIENFPADDRVILKEMLDKVESDSNTNKYEMTFVPVAHSLSYKIIYAYPLIPKNELKPYYDFLNVPYQMTKLN